MQHAPLPGGNKQKKKERETDTSEEGGTEDEG